MALRAGVACADLEFVQFHPTALHHPAMPRPLLSEALRGHGALLRDTKGERFVDELLPRDKVSRAIHARMLELDAEHVYLDATGLEDFAIASDDRRHPHRVGLDPPPTASVGSRCALLLRRCRRRPRGATSLPGLWAAGGLLQRRDGCQPAGVELAARGMVSGPVGRAIGRGVDGPTPTAHALGLRATTSPTASSAAGLSTSASGRRRGEPIDRDELQRGMSLDAACYAPPSPSPPPPTSSADRRRPAKVPSPGVLNLTTVASPRRRALAREETRGAHARPSSPTVATTSPSGSS